VATVVVLGFGSGNDSSKSFIGFPVSRGVPLVVLRRLSIVAFYFFKVFSRLFPEASLPPLDNFAQLLVFLLYRRISSCHYRTNGHI
jgi:hypothetical protein